MAKFRCTKESENKESHLTDLLDGTGVDDGDVNVPVGEEVARQILPEPLVVVDVLGGGPLDGVRLEHVQQQGHHTLVQVLRHGENSGCSETNKL